jgi:BTB/POZ domain
MSNHFRRPRLSDVPQPGKDSDFSLVCGGGKFFVHKVVVCPQSTVLAALERSSIIIPVDEFDLSTLKRMLDFMYEGNYDVNFDDEEQASDSDGKKDDYITSTMAMMISVLLT